MFWIPQIFAVQHWNCAVKNERHVVNPVVALEEGLLEQDEAMEAAADFYTDERIQQFRNSEALDCVNDSFLQDLNYIDFFQRQVFSQQFKEKKEIRNEHKNFFLSIGSHLEYRQIDPLIDYIKHYDPLMALRGIFVEVDPEACGDVKRKYRIEVGHGIHFLCLRLEPTDITSAIFEDWEMPREIGFLRIDLHAHDYVMYERFFLAGLRPRYVQVRVNTLFPPPLQVYMDYDRKYYELLQNLPLKRRLSVFSGGSLSAHIKQFEKRGLELAFFRNETAIFVDAKIKELVILEKVSPVDEFECFHKARLPYYRHTNETIKLVRRLFYLHDIQKNMNNEKSKTILSIHQFFNIWEKNADKRPVIVVENSY